MSPINSRRNCQSEAKEIAFPREIKPLELFKVCKTREQNIVIDNNNKQKTSSCFNDLFALLNFSFLGKLDSEIYREYHEQRLQTVIRAAQGNEHGGVH